MKPTDTSEPTTAFTDGRYWHPWHKGGPVWPMSAAEAEKRSVTINTIKPEAERPERNRLFKLADLSNLPELDKAWTAYDKAWTAYDKARAAYDKAGAASMPAILALHAAQCGCRWTPEDPNIFEDGRP